RPSLACPCFFTRHEASSSSVIAGRRSFAIVASVRMNGTSIVENIPRPLASVRGYRKGSGFLEEVELEPAAAAMLMSGGAPVVSAAAAVLSVLLLFNIDAGV